MVRVVCGGLYVAVGTEMMLCVVCCVFGVWYDIKQNNIVLQCVAVCCSAAVCCSVLQRVGTILNKTIVCCSVLQCVAVFSVLQCVEVCCSVLQRVAACCSVLRCVAACCSVL